MSKRRIARQQIATAHLRSTTRAARLLAASAGDADHAARIDRVLDDLTSHAVIPLRPDQGAPAPQVIRFPRPYDREAELAELVERRPSTPLSIAVWALAGLGLWIILGGLAFALYALASAL